MTETERKNLEWYRSLPVMRLADVTTFERMPEYSGTFPTGVSVGKMWRRHHGEWDPVFLKAGGIPKWVVCRYEEVPPQYQMTNLMMDHRGAAHSITTMSLEENKNSRRLYYKAEMCKTVFYRPVIRVRL